MPLYHAHGPGAGRSFGGTVGGFRRRVGLVIALALLLPLLGPFFPIPQAMTPGHAAAAQAADDGVEHPRRAMTEAAFQRLKTVLEPDYPMVAESTLHFIDVPVANAWVNQNAEIYVATGLLDLLQTEEQIAGVLAHEFAHVTQQHVPKQIRRHWQWLVLWIAAGIAADREHRSNREQRSILNALYPLVMNAYSREAELEADQVALRHLERAGYPQGGLLESLELLHAQSSRAPVEELALTHPLPEIRLGALRRYIDPRMGIRPRPPARWDDGPRTVFDDPVDAAVAFLQATWSDPARLGPRVRSGVLPPELQPGASPGLYPARWPEDFPVKVLGVNVEREERQLLTHIVVGHLDFETPLGTAHGPSLEIRLQPAADGWAVDQVRVLPTSNRRGLAAAHGEQTSDETPPPFPGWQAVADGIAREIAKGNSGLWETLSPGAEPAAQEARSLLKQLAVASASLQAAGFRLHPIGTIAQSLDEADFAALAPEDWKHPGETATYVDATFFWEVQGPQGETIHVGQRLWMAFTTGDREALLIAAEPVPVATL